MERDYVRYEKCEIDAWSDFYDAAPPSIAKDAGIVVHRKSFATIAVAACSDALALNRALGFGLGGSVTAADVDETVMIFSEAGVRRFFVQVPPIEEATKIGQLLTRRGFRHYNNWVRLYRTLDDVHVDQSVLKVRDAKKTDADVVGSIVATTFDWPDAIGETIASTVRRPSWKHYLAEVDGNPVATAATWLGGEIAWVDFAATLTGYRGRGAQKSLIAQRIKDAKASGCRVVIVEAAEPKPDKPALSYENLKKLGFVEAYRRPNYLFEF